MVESLDPKKYHVLSQPQLTNLILIALLTIIIAVPTFGYLYYKIAINRPSQTEKELTFEIKKGDSITTVSDGLYKRGALNSQHLFNFYVKNNHLDSKIQAGVYTIPAGTSIVELAELFQHGTNDIQVTLLEGWRAEEIARALNQQLPNVGYNSFLNIAKTEEGYLFPDTYRFNKDTTEVEVLMELKNNFKKRTEDILTENALSKVGLTKTEALIFASIIEREVKLEDDRKIVAGILINRWKDNYKLEADATTQYAVAKDKFCIPDTCRQENIVCKLSQEVLECPQNNQIFEINWWPQELLQYDLDFNSPYNTRKNIGLPPTPICNPSLAAIEAVLNYEDTNYFFYLTDMDGVTHYATTLEQHNNNVTEYLR